MTKEELLSITEKPTQPCEKAQIEFSHNVYVILTEVNRIMLSQPYLVLLVGP